MIRQQTQEKMKLYLQKINIDLLIRDFIHLWLFGIYHVGGTILVAVKKNKVPAVVKLRAEWKDKE